ncbi:MAG: carboxy methyl transferase for protein phosphatase 2A [Peltula sp. TS41687]|nr:MAG: carboxy methyl transferase for protein phosphatase 2A [Peltula sp. TS41687]
MSKQQQIPHLRTFLSSSSSASSRLGGKARSRLRQQPQTEDGGSSVKTGISSSDKAKDKIVQDTDRDASVSRLSAVELGYLEDPFARQFLMEDEKSPRRFPIINRGTYVRTHAIDSLVDKFLFGGVEEDAAHQPAPAPAPAPPPRKKKQIISLGAGSDTRYFRLMSARPSLALVYHELDFASNTAPKIASIKASSTLLSLLSGSGSGSSSSSSSSSSVQISADLTSLTSPSYNIHPIDLRTLHVSKPALPNLDPTLPTLLLSECCLIYLPPADADAILKHLTSDVFKPETPLGMVIYEPIRPADAFGRVMVQNLARRGIVMQTLKRYGSLGRQRERLRVLGFETGQGAADVHFIWEEWVGEREKERVGRLEMLDEVEEWRLLAGHYCVAWGWREREREGGESSVFGSWRQGVVGQLSDD